MPKPQRKPKAIEVFKDQIHQDATALIVQPAQACSPA